LRAGKVTFVSTIVSVQPTFKPEANGQKNDRPSHIKPQHWQEWRDSGVHPDIISLSVISLEGTHVYDYLLTGELPRRNDGRIRDHILKKVTHCEQGGWWCQGEGEWGQFKPDKPRRDRQTGKPIKYEAPQRLKPTAYLLPVSWLISWNIAKRQDEQAYQDWLQRFRQATEKFIQQESSPILEELYEACRRGGQGEVDRILQQELLDTPRHCEAELRNSHRRGIERLGSLKDVDFWQWVNDHPQIPITLTEGAKKAGALLTSGYVAIALNGIWGGIRTPKDDQGNKIGDTRLIPALDRFAAPGRKFQFAFDQDTKPKTVQQVNKAITETAWQLKQKGSPVSIIQWSPKLGKGIDDVIAQHGCTTLDDLYNHATSFENWKAQSYSQLTHEPQVLLNRRYLGELTLPASARLVGIKSAKGTGKTESLISVVAEAQSIGQKVLVLTHRVQLGQALCNRFGLDYITELKTSDTRGLFGYGLCADSLHLESQARFNPEDWDDCLVIIDEVEQVIWHSLNSPTCQRNRVAILKSLKAVLQNAQRVIVADADLSDTSLDYLIKLLGKAVEPYVIRNDWRPGDEHRWLVHHYTDSTPASLVAGLENELRTDGKALVLCSGQKAKSRWGTQALEAHFQKLFPDLRILRIDSESIADPNHPAYGCIGQLNQILGQYDLVLASPSIETGVSIDIKGHFTACFGIFQGVQAVNSACQMLARLREPVARFIWAAPHGIGKISQGELSVTGIQASQHKLARANIQRLLEAGLEVNGETFQTESVECWAKMAVRINAGMIHYRNSLIEALKTEGHHIVGTDDVDNIKEVKDAVTAAKEEIYQAQCEAIASISDITEQEYELLKDQRAKTADERHKQRRHELQKRYASPTVTPDLVQADDSGIYPKLRLHYYLTLGRDHVTARDKRTASAQVEQGKGDVWRPDFNRSQLRLKVEGLELLNLPALLADPDREFKNSDADLQEMARIAKSNPGQVRVILGVTVRESDTPIVILRRCLEKLGAKLTCLRMEGSKETRIRVYQLAGLDDGRDRIFQRWLERDISLAEGASKTPAVELVTQSPVHTVGNKEINIPSVCTNPTVCTTQTPTAKPQWQAGDKLRYIGEHKPFRTKYKNLVLTVKAVVQGVCLHLEETKDWFHSWAVERVEAVEG
jgi:hypothetical protein